MLRKTHFGVQIITFQSTNRKKKVPWESEITLRGTDYHVSIHHLYWGKYLGKAR